MKKQLLLLFTACVTAIASYAQAPTITSFTPASGPVGTLVTITGTNLSSPTAFTIGGISAIVVSDNGDTLVGMVMPGGVTGAVSVTTAGGTAMGTGSYIVTATPYPSIQQGNKLVGSGAIGNVVMQGWSVALSADGNTAIVGGAQDSINIGAAWVYTRTSGIWTQQGGKLVGTGAIGASGQGSSVALSADGNTAIVGGFFDDSLAGAAWVYTRSGGVWTQQGSKLVGTGAINIPSGAQQGVSAALSADGNTAMVGGYEDNNYAGAVWIFVRSGGIWTQQGSKLTGTGAINVPYGAQQGFSVSLSADGNTAVECGGSDDNGIGATWVFTRSGGTWTQQGNKLVGTGAVNNLTYGSGQGQSVSLSADGNTAIVGGPSDSSWAGAAWVFTRSGSIWSQQGNKLVGTGSVGLAFQGFSVSLSADGNTAAVGGYSDNGDTGAVWVYTRSAGIWTQRGPKLVGTGSIGTSEQGVTVSISADGNTMIEAGSGDSFGMGAVWVYIPAPCVPDSSTTSLTICSTALPYFWNGLTFTAADTQTAHLTNATGCDSAATLYLTVLPASYTALYDSICSGTAFSFAGQSLTQSGIYTDTLHAVSGCDSIVTLYLTVKPSPMVTMSWDSLVQEQFLVGWEQDTIWCIGSRAIIPLVGGMPAGGIYSGNYIQSDTLNLTNFHTFNQNTVDSVFYTYTATNGCSASLMDTLYLFICEGISELNVPSITLHPNPNTGSFTLETSGAIGAGYTICDMIGRQMASAAITSDSQPINVPLSPGIYQITVRSLSGEMSTLRYEVLR